MSSQTSAAATRLRPNPTARRPRILLWESADQRVRTAGTRSGGAWDAVGLDEHLDGWAGSLSTAEIVAAWSADGRDGVDPPSTPAECAAAAVALRLVDGAVGGAAHTSADVLRAGLSYVGAESTVSMAMIAEPPPGLAAGRRVLLADCAVVPLPNPEQLADIAIASADTWTRTTGETARVALVSSTTKAPSSTPGVARLHKAMLLVGERRPDILIGGEFQIDAAVSPEVAKRKAANDPVMGQANVLVFPSLDSANAGYKLLQHLGGYAITPVTQQMRMPFFDISRGCTVEEFLSAVRQCAAVAAASNLSEEGK